MRDAEIDGVARRAAKGDAEAFAAVCRALQDDVWRYCHALLADRDLAFDAAQETFLRATTAIRRYRGDGPVRVYLLVIARRAVAQVLRKERGRPEHAAGDAMPERSTADPTGMIDARELVRVLPFDLRQAFVLTQMVGLDYQQAATVAGCPIGTIRSRVYRARERLVTAASSDAPAQDVSPTGTRGARSARGADARNA